MNAIVSILKKYLRIEVTSNLTENSEWSNLYNKHITRKQLYTVTSIFWDNVFITSYTNAVYIE